MQIIITNAQKKIKLNKKKIEAVAKRTLKILKLPSKTIVNISFISKGAIKELNRKYFKKKGPTDVIALGYAGAEKRRGHPAYKDYLGDIVICPRVCMENSKVYNNNFFSELSLYIIHGLLHLLGYTDASAKDIRRMRKKEAQLLGKL